MHLPLHKSYLTHADAHTWCQSACSLHDGTPLSAGLELGEGAHRVHAQHEDEARGCVVHQLVSQTHNDEFGHGLPEMAPLRSDVGRHCEQTRDKLVKPKHTHQIELPVPIAPRHSRHDTRQEPIPTDASPPEVGFALLEVGHEAFHSAAGVLTEAIRGDGLEDAVVCAVVGVRALEEMQHGEPGHQEPHDRMIGEVDEHGRQAPALDVLAEVDFRQINEVDHEVNRLPQRNQQTRISLV
mmetsp:Transcript_18907/g.54219  ORF Transcript_18907/g.54219 Transcript_18907/m.54219 type:complete len:239 (+) Transcript_18907:907-1623(+)